MKLDVPIYKLRAGQSPLLVSMPHVGIYLPEWLKERLTDCGLSMVDTDWCLDALYDFLDEMDATVICATHSRYVVDLNRPPDDTSLYPGHVATGLCPLASFDGESLYRPGKGPQAMEIALRRDGYWKPYHAAISGELARLRAQHDNVLLFDAHSIRSRVPSLFDGQLPHLSIGTFDDKSCAPSLTLSLQDFLAAQHQYSKGGYITRHYGNPDAGVHAIQLEMAMRCYMNEDNASGMAPALLPEIRALLRNLLATLLAWQSGGLGSPSKHD